VTAAEIETTTETAFDFESFFAANYDRIARVAARVVRDPARAEEIAAEAFYKLWRQPSSLQNSHPLTWLYRTTVHLALDHLKKETRRQRREAGHSQQPSPNPEEQHVITQERERVRQTIAALDTKQAELLLLRFHGLSYNELAIALNLNPASVGTLLSRAQQAFRKEYTAK
jgi:RNA polymerase sigma-70 factor (ECF subfamily)